MKILLVDLDTEWRGGQNQALLMLEGFLARSHKAELISPHGSALGERAEARGVIVHHVARFASRVAAAREIFELTRTGHYDILHANEAHSVTSAWLGRAHHRVPVVISRRVGFLIGKSRLARSRYAAAAKILPISEWVAEKLATSGIPSQQMTVVYEGVEIPRLPAREIRQAARALWGVDDDSPLLGCVGALLPDKGQDLLIRVFAELRAEFPAARLLLTGDGPDRLRLEKLASKLGVRDAVNFAGFVSAMEPVYAALDLFVFPSRFEGLGTSLLAAMSYAIPSIAFSCCAFPEIIEDATSGFLVPTGDEPSLKTAAAAILRDPFRAKAIGEAARLRIEQKFSSPRMVEAMLQLYESLLVEKS